MSVEEKWSNLEKAISTRRSQVIELIQEMVRRPSFEGEGEVQSYITDWWQKKGIEPDIWEPDIEELRTHPGFVDVDYDYKDRPNQVVLFKGQGGGRSLALNGHTDVVPVDPAPRTYGGPWSGEYIDGKVYGRGSVDMKQRQAAQGDLPAVELGGGPDHIGHCGFIEMGVGRQFGCSGGTAGVVHGGDVLRVDFAV